MKKNTLMAAILFFIMSAIAIFLILKDGKELKDIVLEKEGSIILFYGKGCPHCLVVDKYIEENEIDKKVRFKRLEVYLNKANSNLLAEKAAACGINADSIGVPLLWENDQCFIGDQQIISLFDNKLK